MKKLLFILSISMILTSCSDSDEQATSTEVSAEPSTLTALSFADKVAAAHADQLFSEKEALSMDIEVTFGGKTILNGEMTMGTDSRSGIIEYTDGKKFAWRDAESLNTTDMTDESAWSSAMTWSYFALLPYKLKDPGTKWAPYADGALGEVEFEAQKLTFDSGIGDAPDDWYIIYTNPANHMMHVAAYIVTGGGRTIEEAEKDPHAIKYEDYITIDGIPLATKWTFWEWREGKGLVKQLGEAHIINPDFTSFDSDFFLNH